MKRINASTFESPIPITPGKPKDCVELCVYDDDGPEGYFKRLRFARSCEAIDFINRAYTKEEIKQLNFTIENFYGK